MMKPPAVRKISETILDFGEPVLRRLQGDYSDDVAHKVFELVILVWNAHVTAMPRWGQPHFLANLAERMLDPAVPADMVDAVRELTKRRLEHFATDARAVGEWQLVKHPEGVRLRCDARAPHDAK